MMRTFPPSRSAQGFTLMEMLVVLTVVGILAAVMASNFQGRRPFAAAWGQEKKLELAVRQAQAEARRSGKPAELALAAVDGASSPAPLLFYPDGSSNGGQIVLSDRSTVAIDWLTGELTGEK